MVEDLRQLRFIGSCLAGTIQFRHPANAAAAAAASAQTQSLDSSCINNSALLGCSAGVVVDVVVVGCRLKVEPVSGLKWESQSR